MLFLLSWIDKSFFYDNCRSVNEKSYLYYLKGGFYLEGEF